MSRLNRKKMEIRDKKKRGSDKRWQEFLRVENKKIRDREKQN